MPRKKLTKIEEKTIEDCIQKYSEHMFLFDGFAKALLAGLVEEPELKQYIHFIKYRLKSEIRLRDKLTKKALENPRGTKPKITPENLFQEINDLAGVRLIHLHTNQLQAISVTIKRVIEMNLKYSILEGPIAKIWDIEYEMILKGFNIKVEQNDSMYSSVHYVIQANKKTKITFELQVRTLMEEVWGEVSHKVGYEEDTINTLIDSQLKVLARLTSGSTRLVDCIFDTYGNSGESESG